VCKPNFTFDLRFTNKLQRHIVRERTCHLFNKLYLLWPIPVAARSKMSPAGARLLGLRFQIPPGHGNYSVLSVVCCQVEVFATGRSLVQRSPTESGMSNECGREDPW